MKWWGMMKIIDAKNKVLLFDLDGTLVDTEKLAMKVIAEYCVEKKLFSQEAPLKNISELIVGRTWKSAIRDFLDLYSISLDPEQLEADLKAKYRQQLNAGVEWIPGITEKLSQFRSKAFFMGIVTGSSRDEVDIILKAHGAHSWFDQIWSAENYAEGKPSPIPFLTAFDEIRNQAKASSGYEVHAHDVLVFEDSVAGMESSSRAGFPFIQVLHAHPAQSHDQRALLAIQDWRELKII